MKFNVWRRYLLIEGRFIKEGSLKLVDNSVFNFFKAPKLGIIDFADLYH